MSSAPDELLPLGRLEAFSDGVFAIAITLLVLELGVASDAGEHLLRSILHEWPSLLAYITSFLTIGVVWLQHSAITGALRAADATLYRLNLLVLLLVSFLPFPTKLTSEFFGDKDPERVAVTRSKNVSETARRGRGLGPVTTARTPLHICRPIGVALTVPKRPGEVSSGTRRRSNRADADSRSLALVL